MDAPVIDTTTPTQSVTPVARDKNFWLALLGSGLAVVAPLLNHWFHITVDPEKTVAFVAQTIGIIGPIIAFIVSHSIKSGKIVTAEIAARSAQAVAALPAITTPQQAAAALGGLRVE